MATGCLGMAKRALQMTTLDPWIATWDFWMITLDHHMAILGL